MVNQLCLQTELFLGANTPSLSHTPHMEWMETACCAAYARLPQMCVYHTFGHPAFLQHVVVFVSLWAVWMQLWWRCRHRRRYLWTDRFMILTPNQFVITAPTCWIINCLGSGSRSDEYSAAGPSTRGSRLRHIEIWVRAMANRCKFYSQSETDENSAEGNWIN